MRKRIQILMSFEPTEGEPTTYKRQKTNTSPTNINLTHSTTSNSFVRGAGFKRLPHSNTDTEAQLT